MYTRQDQIGTAKGCLIGLAMGVVAWVVIFLTWWIFLR
jgi:hypothetical protein